MTSDEVWTVVTGIVGLNCLFRGLMDLKNKRYVWGAVGLACVGLLFLTPIQSHAVKFDLGRAGSAQ